MDKLSCADIVLVSKFFLTFNDFITLVLVNRKFSYLMQRLFYNPIEIDAKTLNCFPNITTLNLWSPKANTFTKFKPNSEIQETLKLVIWYTVDYQSSLKLNKLGCVTKVIEYTSKNRNRFGNEIQLDVSRLGVSCYSKCTNLNSIVIPERVTHIADCCFEGCVYLSSVSIPQHITRIGNSCFRGCSLLKSIILPNNIKHIGINCFRNCVKLNSINMPSSITYWKGVFQALFQVKCNDNTKIIFYIELCLFVWVYQSPIN
ncbi:hypothetical protein EIN_166970 [Entamoeba invadens IP1]|uniref:Leucine rich repeat containing protein BspA family protein n=1 Tax=Entamoeba invadens IP1 TaxID=370355 RepID=A0A0A1TVJ8_ENTIV|nr:hypothetical protein EIN_166970 [Entamoeba invadens IP1]ELP84432.1 hypothetical protein EIN_166970 [Entamoeba invadens IP1]|eukprot:XP_004183778.1 hypothetical protein EIN_166970 [Entamoeba invadens IP1]